MPIKIRRAVGYALFAAQQDEKHKDAKVLTGFGDAGVLEIIAQHDGDTFRAVYTVRSARLPEEIKTRPLAPMNVNRP
jgi:phage-related protein